MRTSCQVLERDETVRDETVSGLQVCDDDVLFSASMIETAIGPSPTSAEDWRRTAIALTHDLDRAEGQVDVLLELVRSLVDANSCGILHPKSGIWKDAQTVLADAWLWQAT